MLFCGCGKKEKKPGEDFNTVDSPIASPQPRLERSGSAGSDVDSSLHSFCSNAVLMEDYDTIHRLQSNKTTMLELCQRRSDGEQVVVKVFNKRVAEKSVKRTLSRRKSETIGDRMLKEVAILRSLNHPNVLRLIDDIEDIQNGMLYVVMEYMAGGPAMRWNGIAFKYDATEERDCCGLDSRTARAYFRDAAQGLHHIHSKGIIHRDIKPENCLTTVPYQPGQLSPQGVLKIGDFGVSRIIKDQDDMICDTQGTLLFEAPESFTGSAYSGYIADVWALGITLYAFSFQNLPFFDPNGEVLNALISQGEYEIPEGADPDLAELMRQILNVEPTRRITLDDILKHPFVRQCPDSPVLRNQ